MLFGFERLFIIEFALQKNVAFLVCFFFSELANYQLPNEEVSSSDRRPWVHLFVGGGVSMNGRFVGALSALPFLSHRSQYDAGE